jgi:hypothetical protein
MLLDRNFNIKLVHNTSVVSVKFDSSMYDVNTVSGEERERGGGGLKVSKSETGSAVQW